MSDAYDKIDRFLRNNLDDDDYAEYSDALDEVFATIPNLAAHDNQTKEQCAALCYEHNWLIHGSEMAALIEATKEEE